MKERGIIFTGESVRAILAGRKIQTRRVIKDDWWRCLDPDDEEDRAKAVAQCQYGALGDRLWVKEVWAVPGTARRSDDPVHAGMNVVYRAKAYSWRSPIHMPRWASRITLEVTEVRVQRLQDISEEDAQAEGFPIPGQLMTRLSVGYFRHAWDAINGKRAPWASNPWVFAVTFRRLP